MKKSVITVLLASGLCSATLAVDFYVSTTGSDTNAGTFAEPFQSLEKAKLEVRALLPTATAAINVWVRGGTYYLGSTLEFGTADSGSASVLDAKVGR